MELIAAFIATTVVIFFIVLGFRVVRPVERALVERFGSYSHTLYPGLRWVIPFIDQLIRVNVTEIRIDVPKQTVITKDNLNLEIDAVIYYKVKDALKAIYNVDDYAGSIPSLAQTTLRSIVGELYFSEVNASRQTINTKLETELTHQTQEWGIDILRVELQHVKPSPEVQQAMDQVLTAEREREAKITRANAEKEATKHFAEARVIDAEGEKKAKFERATGDAMAIKIKAQAEAEAIRIVNLAAEETFKENAQKFKNLEVTERSLANNSKIILTEHGISPSLIINETSRPVVPIPHINQKELPFARAPLSARKPIFQKTFSELEEDKSQKNLEEI